MSRQGNVTSAVETLVLKQIGVVVPTLGRRILMLEESLRSARAAGADHILLVTGSRELGTSLVLSGLVDTFCLDQDKGLTHAIADGIRQLPNEVSFVNWLGDDDQLEPKSLLLLRQRIEDNSSQLSFVYGRCSYMDVKGSPLFVMPTGPWARYLLRIGPQLISQPACLFRRDAIENAGGLDMSLRWAFDLDLLLKLNSQGKSEFVDQPIAKFRWHSDSLSVKGRRQSVREAQTVRRKHAKGSAHLFLLLNPIISEILFFSGRVLSRYVARRLPR